MRTDTDIVTESEPADEFVHVHVYAFMCAYICVQRARVCTGNEVWIRGLQRFTRQRCALSCTATHFGLVEEQLKAWLQMRKLEMRFALCPYFFVSVTRCLVICVQY